MHTKKNLSSDDSLVTRLLITGGAVGSLLFVIVLLIEGATRPGYSAWHNFGSSLSLSDQGWMQIANFLVCGLLVLGFAVGLRRVFQTGKGSVWGPIMLGVFGASLIVAGLFVTDPSLGYPPGTISSGPQTLHGTIHGLAGLIAFTSLPIASFVIARRFAGDPDWKGWTLYSVVSGVIVLVFFIASTTVSTMDQNGVLPGSPTGLFQRVAIIVGWSWIALLAINILRKLHSSVSTGKEFS